MGFDSLMSEADEVSFDFFGIAARYIDEAINEIPCTVILEEGIDLLDAQYGQVVGKTAAMSFKRSEVNNPKRGETVELLDGNGAIESLYTVEEEINRDPFVVMVAVKRGG